MKNKVVLKRKHTTIMKTVSKYDVKEEVKVLAVRKNS